MQKKIYDALVNCFTMWRMNKQKAIDLLGGSPKKAAEAMGYTSVQAIYMWPEVLSEAVAQRVMWIASRTTAPAKPEQVPA